MHVSRAWLWLCVFASLRLPHVHNALANDGHCACKCHQLNQSALCNEVRGSCQIRADS